MKKLKRQKGISLIELLFVMGFLTGVAVPVYSFIDTTIKIINRTRIEVKMNEYIRSKMDRICEGKIWNMSLGITHIKKNEIHPDIRNIVVYDQESPIIKISYGRDIVTKEKDSEIKKVKIRIKWKTMMIANGKQIIKEKKLIVYKVNLK
ncbi:MAG: type II secretion system protein [bacterium]|nr:type II secretion system protein [bacterium]